MWCALPAFALSHGRRWLRGMTGVEGVFEPEGSGDLE